MSCSNMLISTMQPLEDDSFRARWPRRPWMQLSSYSTGLVTVFTLTWGSSLAMCFRPPFQVIVRLVVRIDIDPKT